MELNEQQKQWINRKLNNLEKSKFRNSFHLNNKMKEYIKEKGLNTIEVHAKDFIEKNLKIYNKEKDGKQTPMKNHPVFIAQHATATCCRSCLEKWYHIPKEKILEEKEERCIRALILSWIEKEISKQEN